MDNRRLDLWTWCSWLLFGWCIFHFIVQLIFEIHACCYARQDYERTLNTSLTTLQRLDNLCLLGFEDADYYPEKNPDPRLRRERVPVRGFLREIRNILHLLLPPFIPGWSMETGPTGHLSLCHLDCGHYPCSGRYFLWWLLNKSLDNEEFNEILISFVLLAFCFIRLFSETKNTPFLWCSYLKLV